ncbi:MAG: hypothetical protein KAT62_11450 [Desulfuromonadales bacterium]|nr:hypothetical protein [Desulfuromonadales bacterium]
MNKYQEQIERLRRYHSRFSEINEGRSHELPSDYYQDDVFAFFLNCYHIKDWIKNDSTLDITSKSVETFINQNNELSICADICNAHKHLKLDKPPRSDQERKFGPRVFQVKVGTCDTEIKVNYTIETISGEIDAFDLATKCLALWEEFIEKNA